MEFSLPIRSRVPLRLRLLRLFSVCVIPVCSGTKSFDCTGTENNVRLIVDRLVEWQNQHDLTNCKNDNEESRRPFITASYAQSLDGKLAPAQGESTQSNYALSGPQSLLLTHAIRSTHDGILIGGGTLSIDNPRLSNRLWGDHQPRPIVLDTQLSRIASLADKLRMQNPIICYDEDRTANVDTLGAHLELLPCRTTDQGRLDLRDVLGQLYKKFKIRSIMVEGGSAVIESFLRQHLVDAICTTIAPQFIGRGIGINLSEILYLSEDTLRFITLGNDCCLVGQPCYDASIRQK